MLNVFNIINKLLFVIYVRYLQRYLLSKLEQIDIELLQDIEVWRYKRQNSDDIVPVLVTSRFYGF